MNGVFRALFASVCPLCTHPVKVGDEVRYSFPNYAFTHFGCSPRASADNDGELPE